MQILNFTLEKWDKKYAQDIAHHANNPNVAQNLRNVFPFPYTLQDAYDYINMCIENQNQNQICRAIVVQGTAVGSVGVFQNTDVYQKTAELGYWLGEEYWRKGIMTNAVTKICEQAFSDLDIVRIYAEPYAYNLGSRGVLEKAGFLLEGVMKNHVYKNGKIIDACMYGLLKK